MVHEGAEDTGRPAKDGSKAARHFLRRILPGFRLSGSVSYTGSGPGKRPPP